MVIYISHYASSYILGIDIYFKFRISSHVEYVVFVFIYLSCIYYKCICF